MNKRNKIQFGRASALGMLMLVCGSGLLLAQESKPIVIAEGGAVTYGGGSASTYSSGNYYAINKAGEYGATVSSIKTSGNVANAGTSITYTGVRGIDNAESTLTVTSMPDGIDISNVGWAGAINQQSSNNTSGSSNLNVQGIGDIKVKATGSYIKYGGATDYYAAKAIGIYGAKNTDISKNKVNISANSITVESEGTAYGIQGSLWGRTTEINITNAVTTKGTTGTSYITNITAGAPTGAATFNFGSAVSTSEQNYAYGFHCAGGATINATLDGNLTVTATNNSATGFRLAGNAAMTLKGKNNKDIDITVSGKSSTGAHIGGTNSTANLNLDVKNFTLTATDYATGLYLITSTASCTGSIDNLSVSSTTDAADAIYVAGGSVGVTFGTISAVSENNAACCFNLQSGTTSIADNLTVSAEGKTSSYAFYLKNSAVLNIPSSTVTITKGDISNDGGNINIGYSGITLSDGAYSVANGGCVVVDMTNATEASYNLISASKESDFGTEGTNYKFADGKSNGYYLEVEGNVLKAVKFSVTVTTAGYATFYFNRNLEVPEGIKVYAYSYDETSGSLIPDEIPAGAVLPANQGYVVKAVTGTYYFDVTSEEAGSCTSVLNGYMTDKNVSEITGGTIYVLGTIDGKTTFYKYTDTVMPAGKAFFIKEN